MGIQIFYFGPKFAPFTPILGKREFLRKIGLRQFLTIMNAYHHAKNQKKTNKAFQRNQCTDGRTDRRRSLNL